MVKYTIIGENMKKIKRFGYQGRTIEFKFNPTPENEDAAKWIQEAIKEIMDYAVIGLESTDQVGITFSSKEFSRGDGWLPFTNVSEITYSDIWNIIAGIHQSNSTGFNTEAFNFYVTSIRPPEGRGRGKNYNTYAEECTKRGGIVTINNKDNMCLPRALVVAISHVDKDVDYIKVRKDIKKIQTLRAKDLCVKAGVSIPENGAGIHELQLFQKYLVEYKITVYMYGHKGRNILYEGEGEGKRLNLLHHKDHYNVITSLTAAFACVYYCEKCHIPFQTKSQHRCKNTCPQCQQDPPCPKGFESIPCIKCNREFRGQQCFNNHLTTVCKEINRCGECLRSYKGNRKHTCGEVYCKTCKIFVPENHLCYMPVDTASPPNKDILFIFYDLETRQETVKERKQLQDGSIDEIKLHEPNLCVYTQVCDRCIDEEKLAFCQKCGMRLQVINEQPIKKFMNYILEKRKTFKSLFILSHNGGPFDHQFLLNYILTKTDLTPELIMRGTKIILMAVENISFLDSINYFPMALAKLPKAFELEELKKGYFPHLFNTLKNQNYVGPLPAVEFYSPDTMKTEDREKFLEWYKENQNNTFDFEHELVAYCVSDVKILAGACLKFRKMMLQEGNVCPFTEACTLPAACNKIYRRNFLKPNTIGIIPKNGYRLRNNQSRIALQWLIWEEKQRGINILHAAKQEEIKINGISVDGFCPETREIYQFHGCWYHGCVTCFKGGRNKPLYKNTYETLDQRYEDTCVSSERLRKAGYIVIEMWECEFKRNKRALEDTEKHPLFYNAPLNPRDAFYGGRTGACKMYYEIKNDEKIKYVDVCSLYPWTNKYGKYPVGHPEVIVAEECRKQNLNNIDGLIKCKILPPQNLYHPLLPIKLNKKLIFCLCLSCAKDSLKECCHTPEERALVGTWVMDEVKEAISLGYEILEVYEIWKYRVEQYDCESKTGGLFTDYMNKFLKIKQQSSGWPKNCKTEEEQKRYIDEYLEREGVLLDKNQIYKNAGLRQLGKSVITSFWGKLGQRENQSKTSIVNESAEFFNMMVNPSIIINTILPVNDNVLIVNWEHKDEAYEPLSTVNVCLAAYTTAQARLKLYSFLKVIDKRVLYYDTDSIIYISKPGELEVPLGPYLGQMTDELEEYGEGSFIVQFVSTGPKTYGYKVYSPKSGVYNTVCKCKGITLNYKNQKKIDFDVLKQMVINFDACGDNIPIKVCNDRISRTNIHEVVTTKQLKSFKITFGKRKLIENYDSLPFGYIKRRKM